MVERDRRDLGAVVTLSDRGKTAPVAQAVEGGDHFIVSSAHGRHQADKLASVEIDDAE